jgi:hypothetical protein
MKIDKTWMMGLGLGLTLPLAGCPGDDTSTTTVAEDDSTTGGGNTDTSTTNDPTAAEVTTVAETADTTAAETTESTGDMPPEACPGTSMEGAAEGDACTANADCATGVCTIYTDVPLDAEAVCAATPVDCGMRITGTVFDFSTGEPLSGADLGVVPALQAATNPTGAIPLIEATSDGDGRVDATTPEAVTGAFGIVGLTAAGGYYLTATGLAAPNDDATYNVGNNIHDIWAVPEGDLGDWSSELEMDPEILPENLPLGDAGGVVGLVRDAAGMPIAGAEVVSTNGDSVAFIRYLQDDGTFSTDATSDRGIFVIIAPMLAEVFEVQVDGAAVGGGTAGSADGAIFTLIVNAG